MTRIFAALALFSLALLGAALVLGFYNTSINASRTAELLGWFRAHFLLGVFSAIVVILVNCIAMTYFIGTSRWCKEVVEKYELDGDLIRRSVSLKRRTFPWALISMLTIVAVAALGAAADTRHAGADYWVTLHLLGALVGTAFIALSFYIQTLNIAAHHEVIDEILIEVRRIRVERGLEV
jgi:hypothetical protein